MEVFWSCLVEDWSSLDPKRQFYANAVEGSRWLDALSFFRHWKNTVYGDNLRFAIIHCKTAPKTLCPRDMSNSTAPIAASSNSIAKMARIARQCLRRLSLLAKRRVRASLLAPSRVKSALAAWNKKYHILNT